MNTLILRAGNRYGPAMGGANLEGCVNDMTPEWRWVHNFRFVKDNINVVVLDDERGTIGAVRDALKEGVKKAGRGEWTNFKVSSHGAEPGLVMYDSDWSRADETFLSADMLAEIYISGNSEAHHYLNLDACVFGDSMANRLIGGPRVIVARGINPPTGILNRDPSLPHPLIPRGISNLTTFAGCQKGGTCADVRDPAGAYGGFSHLEMPERKAGLRVSQVCNNTNVRFQEQNFEQRAVWTGPDREWCT